MKVTVDETITGISTFLQYCLYEIFDSTTIEFLEHQIGQCMKTCEIDDYSIRTTVLDRDSLRINLKFDEHDVNFFLARGE